MQKISTCELGGIALPAGANIFYSQFVTHRLPELYEEPDRFKPERWLMLNRSPYEYLPFGAGHHRCIGAELATFEMHWSLMHIHLNMPFVSTSTMPMPIWVNRACSENVEEKKKPNKLTRKRNSLTCNSRESML